MSDNTSLIAFNSPTEQQNRFIELRAQGFSYRDIAKDIGVSVNTLRAWEKRLSSEIAELKAIELDDLHTRFYMAKEARIARLGDTLNKLTAQEEARDFSDIPTDKLLDLKMKFMKELKEELVEPRYKTDTKLTSEGLIGELLSLLNRIRNGEVTKEQAYKENFVLANLLKANDSYNVEQKIQALEAIIKGRK